MTDPDTLGRAEIKAMDALIDSGLSRQIRGDGNTLAAVVSAVLAAAVPVLTAPPARQENPRSAARVPTFEELLTDPMEQLDPRSELLPHVLQHMQEAAPADPARPANWRSLENQAAIEAAALAAVQRAGGWFTALQRLADIGAFSKRDIAFDVVTAAQPLIVDQVRADDAATVAGLCHWTINHWTTHHEFHFGFSCCPYEAAAAVLRGEPDPRGARGGPTSDFGPSNEVAKPEPGTGDTR